MDMTDLEPNVDLRERSRGRFKNKLEALWVGGGQDGMRRATELEWPNARQATRGTCAAACR